LSIWKFTGSEQRSVARVNRELSLLRHALKIAMGEGWLHNNPFVGPKPLIHTADEVKRKRVLGRDEEIRLLEACRGPRGHLMPIIICAIDTGLRRGEIFKLKWSDLDWAGESLNIPESRAVYVQEFNTKTLRARLVPITKRFKFELQTLWEKSDKSIDDLVFGITNNLSKSFATACHIAEIEDLRFHDLRRFTISTPQTTLSVDLVKARQRYFDTLRRVYIGSELAEKIIEGIREYRYTANPPAIQSRSLLTTPAFTKKSTRPKS
jgi:integrase